MASTIIIKNGTSGTPSSLVQGELAIDVSTGKLFHGTTGGTAVSSSFTFTEVTASGVIKAEHFLSTDDAEITDDLTVGGTDFFVDTSADKVGIGTNTANELHHKLTIYSSAEAGIQFQNNDTGVTNSTDGCRISVFEDDIQYTNYET